MDLPNLFDLFSGQGVSTGTALTLLVLGLLRYLRAQDADERREEEEWEAKLERNLRRPAGEPWEE